MTVRYAPLGVVKKKMRLSEKWLTLRPSSTKAEKFSKEKKRRPKWKTRATREYGTKRGNIGGLGGHRQPQIRKRKKRSHLKKGRKTKKVGGGRKK